MLIIRKPENEIEWIKYYDLRYKILRQEWGQIKGSEKDEGDINSDHFALFYNSEILAVARLDLNKEFAQIRYFAVEKLYQNKGIGSLLLKYLENFCFEKKIKHIILQARENAIPFYLKNDYKIIEKTHLLFNKIQHFKMEKTML